MSKIHDTGKWGEQLAHDFFVKKGFIIEATNWRWNHKEIDLIVSDTNSIIFIEVKTRTAGLLSKPEDALTNKKQKDLLKAAEAYLIKNDITKEARFDVISIYVSGNDHKLTHIPNAFGPQW